MSRDDSIKAVLRIIQEYWLANPDLRLMQLILNATGDDDQYYLTDLDLLAKLGDQYEDLEALYEDD